MNFLQAYLLNLLFPPLSLFPILRIFPDYYLKVWRSAIAHPVHARIFIHFLPFSPFLSFPHSPLLFLFTSFSFPCFFPFFSSPFPSLPPLFSLPIFCFPSQFLCVEGYASDNSIFCAASKSLGEMQALTRLHLPVLHLHCHHRLSLEI